MIVLAIQIHAHHTPVVVDQMINAPEIQTPAYWENVNVVRMKNAPKLKFVALVYAEVCYFSY